MASILDFYKQEMNQIGLENSRGDISPVGGTANVWGYGAGWIKLLDFSKWRKLLFECIKIK